MRHDFSPEYWDLVMVVLPLLAKREIREYRSLILMVEDFFVENCQKKMGHNFHPPWRK
jgi:hypothetical protein